MTDKSCANDRMRKLMTESGFENGASLADAAGVHHAYVYGFMNLTKPPINKDGAINPALNCIAAALDCLPEDLFEPDEFGYEITRPWEKFRTVVIRQVGNPEVFDLSRENEPLSRLEMISLSDTITALFATLTPREERVLRLRFGFSTKGEHTLEELGEKFSTSKERLRQIEAKALRKLRHPSRSFALSQFNEDTDK